MVQFFASSICIKVFYICRERKQEVPVSGACSEGGAQIKAKPAGYGVITPADVQYFAQRQVKSKKKVITPSDCPLYEYHLYFVHLSALLCNVDC